MHTHTPRVCKCSTNYHDREKYIKYYFINFYRLGVRCRVQKLCVVVDMNMNISNVWQCGLNRAQYRIERLKSFSNENE